MSKVVTTTLLPDVAGGTVTLGGTGDNVVVTGNDLRTNVIQDAGGNAVFTSNGSGVLSGMDSAFGGALTLLSTQTASNVASVSFTTQLTSTYDIYIFKFINMHPITDVQPFSFQVNASGQTGFNETITSTFWDASHTEGGTTGGPEYEANDDQAQGTGYQRLARGVGNLADEAMSGELHLYSPASTTYAKQFYSRTAEYMGSPRIIDNFVGGYINTTTAITEIDFKFDSGNIDSGTIKLYGISKS